MNTISSCNYDGSSRRVVLYSTDVLRHPFSITTFEDSVYWTDWDKAAVYRANKFNGKNIEAITSTHTVSLALLQKTQTFIYRHIRTSLLPHTRITCGHPKTAKSLTSHKNTQDLRRKCL